MISGLDSASGFEKL